MYSYGRPKRENRKWLYTQLWNLELGVLLGAYLYLYCVWRKLKETKDGRKVRPWENERHLLINERSHYFENIILLTVHFLVDQRNWVRLSTFLSPFYSNVHNFIPFSPSHILFKLQLCTKSYLKVIPPICVFQNLLKNEIIHKITILKKIK